MEKFQYWDYMKNQSDSTFNIAFRIFSTNKQKSDMLCSITNWNDSHNDYN